MAFNLNKSDESISKIDLLKKSNSASKFDLSKNNDPLPLNGKENGKSKTWVFALFGVLLLGGGAWYFLSKSNNTIVNEASSNSVVESNAIVTPSNGHSETSKAVVDSPASAIQENNTSSDVSVTQNETSATNTSGPSNNESVVNTSSNVSKATLNNKVYASFDKASASFSSIDNSLVKDIVAFLEKNPNASITVNGYASSEGILAVNQKISQSRANTFKEYLISKGISENRVVANGKGIDHPIASNDAEEGRQKNRRVEISIQ
ncbi:OmpA family protein [Flavobacterium sp. LT1R49]|uniref:OmpA family protein n=1 Tax=Flavobacterium arabinosi TaxID=3398737 RepID=UPI003A88E34B